MLDPRLKAVVAVSRNGSFTAAAEAIGVTQPAITKSIADLEAEVGYAIFHRTSRGALLTERGRDFIERAARILEDVNDLFRGERGTEDAFAGVLRIGVCPASLEWRLVEPLAELIRRRPSIRLDVSGASFERMVQLLRNGAVDLAVGFEAAFAEWPDIQREAVPPLKSVLFVRRGHPILERNPITRADLVDFVMVSPSDSRPYGSRIREVYESRGVDWRKRVHTIDYFPSVRKLVASTDVIGVVTLNYTQLPGFADEFVSLGDMDLFPPSALCCAFRARTEASPSARAFLSELRSATMRIRHKMEE